MRWRATSGIAGVVVLSLAAAWYLQRHSQQAPLVASVDRADARRVISMAPSVTEIVFALGQGERLVGVSDFSEYPEEAKSKPRCGGWMNPNFEVITTLRPDLVVIQGSHRKVTEYCDLYGIPLAQVALNDLPAVFSGIRVIGEVLGVPHRAEELNRQITASLDSTRSAVSDFPKLKVLLLLQRMPGTLTGLTTIGPHTFLDQVVDLAGGENLFRDATIDYPQASKEAVVARQPDVILEMHPGKHYDAATVLALKQDWSPLSSIPAVRNGRIYIITEGYALIPGPRVGRLARRIAHLLHPELSYE